MRRREREVRREHIPLASNVREHWEKGKENSDEEEARVEKNSDRQKTTRKVQERRQGKQLLPHETHDHLPAHCLLICVERHVIEHKVSVLSTNSTANRNKK